MKKYYTTMSPDSARHILKETLQETIDKAKVEVAKDGRTRYVVKVIYKIEPDSPPVKVTRVE